MKPDWVTYRHPLGLMLSHPAGWRVQQAQAVLQFIPDDFDRNTELIVASEVSAPVPRIDDPAVLSYIDDSIRQAHPGLTRTGDPAPIKCRAGDGITLDYAGQLGDGRPGAAVVYSVLVDGSVVSLTAIATSERIAQRRLALADIFATFAAGAEAGNGAAAQPQVDPDLVGTWRQGRARHSSDALGGGTFDSSSTTYFLAADGTYTTEHSSFIGIDLPGGSGGSGRGTSQSTGTWSANGEFLVLRGPDGAIVVAGQYKVFRNGVEVYPPGGDMVLLHRV